MLRAAVPSLLLACAGAAAQVPSGPPEQPTQRLVTEDAGARVEELRVGGQTRSITVQPKNGAPAYEIDPGSPARTSGSVDERTQPAGGGGRRAWNVLRF